MVAISCQQRLFLNGRYDRVDNHAQAFPKRKWKKLSCGPGSKGQRFYQWAFVPFGVPTEKGLRKGLLVRRCLKNSEELAYYFTHAPKGTPLAKLVRVAGSRWAIEECFEQAKQETGLDEYEVRSWTGQPPDYVQAIILTLLFYLSLTLWPVLIFALFNERRRMLHDYLAGTLTVRRSRLAAAGSGAV